MNGPRIDLPAPINAPLVTKSERVDVDFGDITLAIYSTGDVWLLRPSGEGMQCGIEKFTAALEEFYSSNF